MFVKKMALVEDSFVLLSSMSPKVHNTKKATLRKATKLGLKKHVRRSSFYDKKPHTGNNSVVCMISTSSEAISSDDEIVTKNIESTASNTVIVIESSSDTESMNDNVTDKDSYKTAKSIISESDIDDNNILENSGDHNSFKNKKQQILIMDKNSAKENCLENSWEDLEEHKSLNNDVSDKEAKENEYKNYIDGIIQKYSVIDATKSKDKTTSPFVQQWIQELNTNFEDFKITKEIKETNANHGDVLDNSFNVSFNNLSIQDDLVQASLEDSDTEMCPSTPKLLDDQEKLLDQLYGPLWRESQGKPMPKTEKKKQQRQFPLNDKCKTEIKGKKSMTYKNPYLDSEKKKSSLLRTLHTARLRINIESPWSKQLNSLCDSDTSSDKENNTKNIKRRLNFEDSEDDNSNSDNVNSKKLTLTESDKNLTDKKNEGQIKTVRKKKLLKSKPKYEIDTSSDTSSSDDDSSCSDNKHFTTKVNRKVVLQKPKPKETTGVYSFLASLTPSVPITSCDPSARLFRESFKIRKDELVKKLFIMFNENIFEGKLPHDMLLEWNDRMISTAGYCYCRKITRRTGIVERNARIVFSTKVNDTACRLRDTLIHEMCHAATWILNEVSNGHGPLWKAWTIKAMKVYPELPPIKRCHSYVINPKYTYKCTSCGYSIGRHSKSLDIERKRCGYCFGKFELLINKTTKDGLKSVPVTPQKKLSAFANFVKQNYKNVKTQSLKHGDVMKILSKQFNEIKFDEK